MKYNSIEGIIRWYENGSNWEEWDSVKERALKEWKEEVEAAYKSGVEQGVGNRNQLRNNLETAYKKIVGDIIPPMERDEWFVNNWK